MKKLLYFSLIMSFGVNSFKAQNKSITTFSGHVLGYNKEKGFGCFYVNPEMVEAGVAEELGNKTAGTKCVSEKYGQGVPINFAGLNPKSDYNGIPEEDVLISLKGRWIQNAKKQYEIHATEWEPFF